MPCGACENALAGRFCLSALRRTALQFLQTKARVPMQRLPPANLCKGRHYLPPIANAAEQMVPRDVFHDKGPKNDVAALELMRHLDVTWDCAWLMKQKLMEVMFQRNSMYKLEGDIQIDDAYQGGEMPAIPGKSGRGARNKVPFIVAVQTQNGRPIFAHIRCSAGFDPRRRSAIIQNDALRPVLGS